VYALVGADARHAVVVQSILFALMVVMLYVAGKRLTGRLTGIVAALLLAAAVSGSIAFMLPGTPTSRVLKSLYRSFR